jgi:hypothetical protein
VPNLRRDLCQITRHDSSQFHHAGTQPTVRIVVSLLSTPAKIDVSGRTVPTVDATTFRLDFRRYRDKVHHEPVKMTSHGRVIGGFLSSHDLEHYEQLKRLERQVYVADELPGELIEAIEKAEYLKPASQHIRLGSPAA